MLHLAAGPVRVPTCAFAMRFAAAVMLTCKGSRGMRALFAAAIVSSPCATEHAFGRLILSLAPSRRARGCDAPQACTRTHT